MKILCSLMLLIMFSETNSLAQKGTANSLNTESSRTELFLNKSIQSQLNPKKVDTYGVYMAAGQFASIRVKQRSIGVYYLVLDPKGKLIQIGDFNGIDYSEVILIEASVPGEYKIQVGWDYGEPRVGDYEILLNKLEKSSSTPTSKCQQLLNSWYGIQNTGAVVAVLKDHKVALKAAKGLANVEYNIPNTTSTLFELASNSKQFTGFAIAMLVDKGLLSLDDDIRKYIPEVPDFGKKITISNLIYHTSGIRDFSYSFQLAGHNVEDVTTTEMILSFVANQKQLNFNPGDEFAYSNTGYNLLAEVVKRVTKQPFSRWAKENIFEPLGMTSTFVREDYRDAVKNGASSYASDGSPFKLKTGNMGTCGSNSVYSNLDDLIKWVDNLDSHVVGSKAVFRIINTQGMLNNGQKLGYAFGNDITTYKKVPAIAHLGLTLGYRTSIRRFPDQRISVIYLSNDGNDATFGRADRIADLYVQGLEVSPPPTMPKFPEISEPSGKTTTQIPGLADYVGTYYSEELAAVYTLKIINGDLIALNPRIAPIVLTCSKTDNFSANRPFMKLIQFNRNAKNEIIGLKVSNGSDRNMVFTKM